MTKQNNINIIIFGGGTSGWLTAAYLVNNLQFTTKITLIEDKSKGPIGVGEGTQPFTPRFLMECGIPPKMWMKPSNSSLKYGVELIDWNDEPYFVDNDVMQHQIIEQDFYVSDYFMSKSKKEYFDWYPSYRLAKKNVSQMMGDNLNINAGQGIGAVHFGAYDIIETIKSLILDKIEYVNTSIKDIVVDETGISYLRDTRDSYRADLYFDCSGFKSSLLGESLDVPFNSYRKWLLNDRAVAIPTEYNNPQTECHPYTKATTMKYGWRWTIPTFHRIGNGYVYSSDYLTEEDAEHELRTVLNDFNSPSRHLKMKTGYHERIAHKNVVGVGLSAGFVEPLEATGITFTTSVVKLATEMLNRNGWNDETKRFINENFRQMNEEILAFIWAHYHWSTRKDTQYWRDVRRIAMSELPDGSRKILNSLLPVPKRFYFDNPTSMFNVCQWFSVLKSGGVYDNISNNLSDEQIMYGQYYTETISKKIELVEKYFPNLYDFLTKWYDGT